MVDKTFELLGAALSDSSFLSALNSYSQRDYADKLLYHQALN